MQYSMVRFMSQTNYVVQRNLSAILDKLALLFNVSLALKLLYTLLLNKQWRHAI